MKTVFDPSFKYKRSIETDVRKTFERIRREQQAERRKKAQAADSSVAANSDVIKVVQLDQIKKRI
jgi:hypothetical protein